MDTQEALAVARSIGHEDVSRFDLVQTAVALKLEVCALRIKIAELEGILEHVREMSK